MTTVTERIRDALTNLHERPLDYPQWGLEGAMLREFTARERQYANDAVQAQDDDPDQILFRAMLLQRCITDPTTGTPYPDGRYDPATGLPAIDPRTRTPIFSLADIQDIADGRGVVFTRLWDDLLELAGAGPRSLFRGGAAANGAERDQGARAEAPGDPASTDADPRTGDADGGGASAGEPVEAADAPPERTAGLALVE